MNDGVSANLLERFNLIFANKTYPAIERDYIKLSKISIDECAQQCKEKMGDECKSFSFCSVGMFRKIYLFKK